MDKIIVSDRPIKATSFSRLKVYNQCSMRAYFAYIKKIKEPERPALPKGQEYPNDRGSRVHDELEQFVQGHRDKVPVEAKGFTELLETARAARLEGKNQVFTEDTWCFDKDWNYVINGKTDFKNTWLRVILDMIVFVNKNRAVVIDYKTGRMFGNEVDHARQMQLYQLVAFMLFPDLEFVTTELWYIDHNEIVSMDFRRSQGLRFFAGFSDGFTTMTTSTTFVAKPNIHNCRFCPYKTGVVNAKQHVIGTGDCTLNP